MLALAAALGPLAVGCAPTAEVLPDQTAPRVAETDRLRVELVHDAGEPASGEKDSFPEIVYTGRHARVAVTLTDSEYGVPVAGVQVAAKVVATTWIGPEWRLQPAAPQSGVYEGVVGIPMRGPYRIDVEVELPGGRSYVQFGFDY